MAESDSLSAFTIVRRCVRRHGGDSSSSRATLAEIFYELTVGHFLFREPRDLEINEQTLRVRWNHRDTRQMLDVSAPSESMIVLYRCLAKFVEGLITDRKASTESAGPILNALRYQTASVQETEDELLSCTTESLAELRHIDRVLAAFLDALGFRETDDIEAVVCLVSRLLDIRPALESIQQVWELRRAGFFPTIRECVSPVLLAG